MSEHSEKVEYRRKVLNAEIWAKKTKEIMMVAKRNGIKTWNYAVMQWKMIIPCVNAFRTE